MQPFLADVGSLHRVPLDNQTIQKREGYRDILHAWLMLEAATKLDWPGRKTFTTARTEMRLPCMSSGSTSSFETCSIGDYRWNQRMRPESSSRSRETVC